jgi:histidine triad (HIT) family protein
MSSIFTKIIQGKIPSYKIAENEKYFAFLDIKPINPGHTLVIPKKEVDYIFDIDDCSLGEFLCFSKMVARAIQKAVPCKRVGIMVAGLQVPHAHVHLVPIIDVLDLNFANAREALPSELEVIAKKIRAHIVG